MSMKKYKIQSFIEWQGRGHSWFQEAGQEMYAWENERWFGLVLTGNDRVGNGSHVWKNALTPFKHHRVQSKAHTVLGGTAAQGF